MRVFAETFRTPLESFFFLVGQSSESIDSLIGVNSSKLTDTTYLKQ